MSGGDDRLEHPDDGDRGGDGRNVLGDTGGGGGVGRGSILVLCYRSRGAGVIWGQRDISDGGGAGCGGSGFDKGGGSRRDMSGMTLRQVCRRKFLSRGKTAWQDEQRNCRPTFISATHRQA